MTLLSRLRRRAMTAPTRALRAYWLRALVRNRAKRGIWDARMLNGHPGGVTPAVRRFIMRGVARDLVVTSTTDGRHAPNSYHGDGRAADMGVRPREIGTAKGRARLEAFQRAEFLRGGYRELIGPLNRSVILGGHRTHLQEGAPLEEMHDNHVHGAV